MEAAASTTAQRPAEAVSPPPAGRAPYGTPADGGGSTPRAAAAQWVPCMLARAEFLRRPGPPSPRGEPAAPPPLPAAPALARALADSLVDAAYGACGGHLWRGRRVAVTWTAYNDGMGDAMAAAKVARVLSAHTEVIAYVPPCGGGERLFSFLGDNQIFFRNRVGAVPPPAVDLVVNVNGPRELAPVFELHGRHVPALQILEHDVPMGPPAPHILATGLGADRCGIFCGPAALPPPPPAAAAGWQRLSGALGLQLGPVAPDGQPRALHACYPSTASVGEVVETCRQVHGPGGAHLDVLLVAKDPRRARLQAGALAEVPGFAQVELWRCASAAAWRLGTSGRPAGGSRICRLLVSDPLDPPDFCDALRLSSFTVVTGDQSLAEAIALGVSFAYDAPAHKCRCKAALARLVDGPPAAQSGWRDDLPACAAALAEPASRAQLVAAAARLRQHLDVAPLLVGRCLRVMAPLGGLGGPLTELAQACRRPSPADLETRLARLGGEIAALAVQPARRPPTRPTAAGCEPPGWV